MFSIQATAAKMDACYNIDEKIALLKALQTMYNIDNYYDVIESIGYDSISDHLQIDCSKPPYKKQFDQSDPVAIFNGQKEKQLLLIEILFDAAILDSRAHQNEANLIVSYATQWGITHEEFCSAIITDPLQLIELGLFETAREFTQLVGNYFEKYRS